MSLKDKIRSDKNNSAHIIRCAKNVEGCSLRRSIILSRTRYFQSMSIYLSNRPTDCYALPDLGAIASAFDAYKKHLSVLYQ